MFIRELSTLLNRIEAIEFEPVVTFLYNMLMVHDNITPPLGSNCAINKTQVNQGVPILEMTPFNNE